MRKKTNRLEYTHSSRAISGAMRSLKSGSSSFGGAFSYVALKARYSTNFSATAALRQDMNKKTEWQVMATSTSRLWGTLFAQPRRNYLMWCIRVGGCPGEEIRDKNVRRSSNMLRSVPLCSATLRFTTKENPSRLLIRIQSSWLGIVSVKHNIYYYYYYFSLLSGIADETFILTLDGQLFTAASSSMALPKVRLALSGPFFRSLIRSP